MNSALRNPRAPAVRYSWLLPGKVKASQWFTIILTYTAFQTIVQGITLLCGVLVIRTLSKNDYAIYAVAGSALGLISNLSDLGIGNALLALGGRVWRDESAMGSLVVTALSIRRVFFIF